MNTKITKENLINKKKKMLSNLIKENPELLILLRCLNNINKKFYQDDIMLNINNEFITINVKINNNKK